MTRKYLELFLLSIGVLGFAAWVGCRPRADQPLVVVLCGDTAGWIAPCNCTSNQSGGLARRATYVDRLRRQSAVIVADVGGAVGGTSPYDRLKFEAILRGEAIMGVAAHNIGADEARFGPEYLRAVSTKLGVPLLSANVRDRAGRLVAEPLLIVEAGGRKVALLGVLAERYATAEIDVSPPGRAVLDALRAAPEQYDAVIVLAYLPEDELRRFADTLPEADAIVGGPTGQPIVPKRTGPTLLTSATNKGKFAVRLDAPMPGTTDRWTGAVIELDEQFADEPRQTANLARFRRQLHRKEFTPAQTSFHESLRTGFPKEFGVAGTAACLQCHEEQHRRWATSRHAKAWESLQKQSAHVDPDCQRCHTTGYGLPAGFVSWRTSADRTDVGCENCHGPSRAHAAEPEVRTAYFARARDHCMDCHDRENSPTFDFDEYWKKIEHGTESSKDAGPETSRSHAPRGNGRQSVGEYGFPRRAWEPGKVF